MYSAPYGYPNPAGGPVFNGAPPQQNHHMQPGPSPNQPQQMMFNPQQFPIGAQGAHFPTGPNPAMMGGVGPAGMMQNAAMPHMAANGQSKPPYSYVFTLCHMPISLASFPSPSSVTGKTLIPGPPASHHLLLSRFLWSFCWLL